MEEILHSITAAGYRQLEGKGLTLYRFDSLSESFPDMWRLEHGHITRTYRAKVSRDGITATVLREGKLTVVNDTHEHVGVSPYLPPGIRSFVAVPVEIHGIPWGVLYINDPKPNAFSEEDLSFFQSLARQIGLFLEQSRQGSSPNVELSTVRALAATVDAKDAYTRNHSVNVAFFARQVAREMSLDPAEIHRVYLAALLHDIGKIAVPDQILQKPGSLAAEERLLVQTHASIGASILAQASHLQHLVPLVRHHHEWYNGGGYPDRLKGTEIPLGAAIICLADAFDAMTTPRVYRPAFTLDHTLNEMRRCAGVQFHPDVVEALELVIKRDRDTSETWLLSLGTAARVGGIDLPRWHEDAQDEAYDASRNRDPLDFLAEARLLDQLGDLGAILDRAGERAMSFWGVDSVQIYLINPGDSTLRLSWYDGSPTAKRFLEVCRTEAPPSMTDGLLGLAAVAHQSIIVADARHDPRWAYTKAFDGPVSLLVAPISAGGTTVGVIQMLTRGESRFGRTDLKVIKVLGSLLGAAIVRAQAVKEDPEAEFTDPLTGLRNSNYLPIFMRKFEAGRWLGSMSVAFLDGDDLKVSNDRFGQHAGTHMIQHIARCLTAHKREHDVFLRYAADEFLLFFPGLSLPQASAVLERIRMSISEMPLELPSGQRFYVSVSCGVTEVSADVGPHRAMRAAEQAMYQAKRTGKNRVWVAAV